MEPEAPILDASLQATLKRAEDLEQVTMFPGWEQIKIYIEEQIKIFANQALVTGFTDMNQYNYERGKVAGMRQLLSQIEADLNMLQQYREQNPNA